MECVTKWQQLATTSAALALALCGCAEDDSDGDPGTSAELPPGQEVDGWWVADAELFEVGPLGWVLQLTNISDSEKSMYVEMTFYDDRNRIIETAQCIRISGSAEFVNPNEEVVLNCSPADGTPGVPPLPDFDHYTLGVLDGFPTSQEERDEMGY